MTILNRALGEKTVRHGVLAAATASALAVLLSGCLATAPTTGGGSVSGVTGAAGGETTAGANSQLEKCDETLGTVRIDEQVNEPWYAAYRSRYGTGSTVPVIRLMIQQSNCFVIVDRGRALRAANQERALMRGDEGRAGSNFGGGQIVAADYTMVPEVVLSDRGGTQGGAALGAIGRGLFGVGGAVLGAAAGSMSTNEAGTVLTLVDNRSSVQVSAAEGYSKNVDFGFAGALFGGGAAGGAGAFTRTPQGKVLLAAFIDSYNKMVVALRNYKAQTVKGGLGAGGRLGVQGGSTPASRDIPRR
jgi:hypothetical protein